MAEKHLLKHPFYVMWTEGRLTRENIRSTRSPIPHVAAFHPICLESTRVARAVLRQELLENLVEEERGEQNHRPSGAVLPRRWVPASRISPFAPAPESETRCEFSQMTRSSSVSEGLAALYAYESQIPEISKTSARALRPSTGSETPRRCASSRFTRRPTSGTGRWSAKLWDEWRDR